MLAGTVRHERPRPCPVQSWFSQLSGFSRLSSLAAPFVGRSFKRSSTSSRQFGPRATRIVQLPAGMKVKVPGVTIGSDSYCVRLAQAPANGCTRKVINATYND